MWINRLYDENLRRLHAGLDPLTADDTDPNLSDPSPASPSHQSSSLGSSNSDPQAPPSSSSPTNPLPDSDPSQQPSSVRESVDPADPGSEEGDDVKHSQTTAAHGIAASEFSDPAHAARSFRSEPIPLKFLNTSPETLTLANVPDLLADYRQLVEVIKSLGPSAAASLAPADDQLQSGSSNEASSSPTHVNSIEGSSDQEKTESS